MRKYGLPLSIAILLAVAACSSRQAIPAGTAAPGSASVQQAQTPQEAAARFAAAIDPANLPPGTEMYAINGYYVSGDRKGMLFPANVKISRDAAGVSITTEGGQVVKFPPASTVTFVPNALYVFVHPGEARPAIALTSAARRIK